MDASVVGMGVVADMLVVGTGVIVVVDTGVVVGASVVGTVVMLGMSRSETIKVIFLKNVYPHDITEEHLAFRSTQMSREQVFALLLLF